MKRKGPERNAEKQRFWQRQVARWRHSRQSVRDYCRENSLSEPSFYAWRQELARRSQSSKAGNRTRPKASATATTSQGARQRLPGGRACQRPSLPPTRFAGAPGTPSFLPVRVVQGPAAEARRAPLGHRGKALVGSGRLAGGGVEIVLAHGRAVRVQAGFDRETLAEVLAVLEGRPC